MLLKIMQCFILSLLLIKNNEANLYNDIMQITKKKENELLRNLKYLLPTKLKSYRLKIDNIEIKLVLVYILYQSAYIK